MAAIGLWMLARSKYKLRGTFWLVVASAFVWMVLPPEQKARFSVAGDDGTSTSRLTYWERGIVLANEHPVLGIGYKNWMAVYPQRFASVFVERERVELPHSIFIEAWSELGYLGLGALIFLILGTFWVNAKTRSLARSLGEQGRLGEHLGWGFDGALIGFVVSGSFVTVLYYPFLWVNLGMTVALHLSVARTARALQGARQRTRSSSPNFSGPSAAFAPSTPIR
jgi:O-antigen ligase